MYATRLTVLRHGETDWNLDTRIQGHTDIPLNAAGHWQAARLAKALASEVLTAVYTSDLERAHATALAVARTQRLQPVPDTGLRERCFGALEGLTWAEIEALHPEDALHWRTRVPDWSPPGGGESLQVLRARVLATLNTLAARHLGEHIAVVAHGGVLDAIYRAATGLELAAPRSWLLRNAAINRLLWSPDSLSVVCWGETAHLEPAPGIPEPRDETTT